ncbi:hypothetical protein PG994_011467 [Apiospora phragmitis]|uniref:SWIM-type domain-containing protein n=1 Tax=Apiospora phragmitis TaxID=2905665 RepID=A0ABR1TT34_9PEZI
MTPPSPTERFSQLSIDSMPPTTRSRSRMQASDDSPAVSEHESDDLGYNDDGSFTFPSRLSYSLDELDEGTQEYIVSMMEDNPPKCLLQKCVAREDFIVFQVAELVQHSVRAIQPGSNCNFLPCDCDEHARTQRPCRHMLWLFDQITNQIEPARGTPLTLTMRGYPSELGNIYDRVNEFHLDILDEALHLQVPDMDTGDDNGINPRRVQAIKEMLASLNAAPAPSFACCSRNDSFFQYFKSSLRYDELLESPLKKLQWRMETAIAKFDAFRRAPGQSPHGRIKDAEWCARHLLGVDRQIKSIVMSTNHPLSEGESHEIVSVLMHMIQEVINRNDRVRDNRNLYYVLLGDKDHDFITGTLTDIIPSHLFPFTAEISHVIDTLIQFGYGVPLSYLGKLRRLIPRARQASTSSPSGSKRSSGGGPDSRAKRMK